MFTVWSVWRTATDFYRPQYWHKLLPPKLSASVPPVGASNHISALTNQNDKLKTKTILYFQFRNTFLSVQPSNHSECSKPTSTQPTQTPTPPQSPPNNIWQSVPQSMLKGQWWHQHTTSSRMFSSLGFQHIPWVCLLSLKHIQALLKRISRQTNLWHVGSPRKILSKDGKQICGTKLIWPLSLIASSQCAYVRALSSQSPTSVVRDGTKHVLLSWGNPDSVQPIKEKKRKN